MSKDSSPGHRFSGAYDNFYDPDFTQQISNKMQVPDKISVIEGAENKDAPIIHPENTKMFMHVPERILLAGGNGHIEGREPLPELRLESSLVNQPSPSIVLATPPRSLTLNEYNYPAVEEKPKVKQQKKHLVQQYESGLSEVPESTGAVCHAPEEEVDILRRQVRHLSRRVLAVEQDNQLRQQREIILYSIGVIYFLLKGLVWLHRHF